MVTTEEWKIRQTTGTRKSPNEKIRIVLYALRGEDSISELCCREGISQGIYNKWLKDFMEDGKRRLAGNMARAAKTDEVIDLCREFRDIFISIRLYRTMSTSRRLEMKMSRAAD